MAHEELVQEKLKLDLSDYFTVHEQQWNTGGGKYIPGSKKIDMILEHESGVHLGVEIKCDQDIYKGTDVARWVRQAATYERKLWRGHRILIFIFPQISGRIFDEGDIHKDNGHCPYSIGIKSAHHNVSTFLGNLGCGEIVEAKGDMFNDLFKLNTRYTGYQMNHSGHVIWDEINGLNMKNWDKVMDMRTEYLPKSSTRV